MTNSKKRILVIDDSAFMRRAVCDIINSDNRYEVTDYAKDGLDALEKLAKSDFDVIILDYNMPNMDGLELLQELKKDKRSIPVIMCSTETKEGAEVTLKAMELGAVDFVTKPEGLFDMKGDRFKTKMLEIMGAVTDKNSSKSSFPISRSGTADGGLKKRGKGFISHTAKASGNKIICLASSTGGPKALHEVIPRLDSNMDAPMVLVQHMPAGFTSTMAQRLDEVSKVNVKEAEEGDVLAKGTVYIAPGGKHMEIVNSGGACKVHLSDAPPIGALRPCANVTYKSLIKSPYDSVVCVVLTGMGADGTEGILELEKSKPVYVISQTADTCVVYGMPKAIAESGACDEVVPLDKVADAIMKNVGVK
ncbi:MAG: chemotaxis response regulator protein-glutamate methylesterase [Lachnospiraceae bacterium]|nr:chemotaxis response regulator protein-glutamate methylesterase [Lachnospiraceae bacterium]